MQQEERPWVAVHNSECRDHAADRRLPRRQICIHRKPPHGDLPQAVAQRAQPVLAGGDDTFERRDAGTLGPLRCPRRAGQLSRSTMRQFRRALFRILTRILCAGGLPEKRGGEAEPADQTRPAD